MKQHVSELIDKIEKLCNEGHQTESVLMHIPSTQGREGPSCHTIGQRWTRRPPSVDELEALVCTVELLGVRRGMMFSIISVSVYQYVDNWLSNNIYTIKEVARG